MLVRKTFRLVVDEHFSASLVLSNNQHEGIVFWWEKCSQKSRLESELSSGVNESFMRNDNFVSDHRQNAMKLFKSCSFRWENNVNFRNHGEQSFSSPRHVHQDDSNPPQLGTFPSSYHSCFSASVIEESFRLFEQIAARTICSLFSSQLSLNFNFPSISFRHEQKFSTRSSPPHSAIHREKTNNKVLISENV